MRDPEAVRCDECSRLTTHCTCRHCIECGRVCDAKETFCSESCAETFEPVRAVVDAPPAYACPNGTADCLTFDLCTPCRAERLVAASLVVGPKVKLIEKLGERAATAQSERAA